MGGTRLLAILLYASAILEAQGIRVTSPAPGSYPGALTFQSSVSGLPSIASVEYLVSGHRLFAPATVSPNYPQPWHAAYAANGKFDVIAIALDASGAELARSPEVRFELKPFASGSVTISSPGSFTNLSGTVTVTGVAAPVNGQQPDRTVLFIDGAVAEKKAQFPLNFSYTFDTTVLRNGPHEMFVSATAGAPPSVYAVAFQRFTTANGHIVQELRSGVPAWAGTIVEELGWQHPDR